MIRVCRQCKNEYKTSPSVKLFFCSAKCYGISQRIEILKNCLICNNIFKVTSCRKEAKYCSLKCNAVSLSKLYKGISLSSEVKLKMSITAKGRIVTEETRKKKSETAKRKGIKPSTMFGKNHPNWKYDAFIKNCLQCNNEFKTKRIIAKYCSTSCGAIGKKNYIPSKETKDKIRVWQVNNPNKSFKDTSIELKMEELLKKLGIDYRKQVPLYNIAIVDFYIPSKKLVIQCDGCFYHGCPIHFPNTHIEKQNADIRQDKILQENSLTVLRFWEHEINSLNFKVAV